MKTVSLSELYRLDFDIRGIVIHAQRWEAGQSYTIARDGRPDNGILFMADCEFEYIDENGHVIGHAQPGNIVYNPKGSQYTCRFFPCTNTNRSTYVSDYLINFMLFDENGEEFRLSNDRVTIRPDNPRYYLESFRRIDSLGRKGLAPSARIKAMLYDLLCDLSLELQKNDIMSRSFAAIYPAIEYIRSTDLAEIDTASLAARCHISDSCFRRLFSEYTGMPPLAYVNHLKLMQARAKLQSGTLTVSEIAESLGFSDVSYFSRFYKKATGHSPTEDRR